MLQLSDDAHPPRPLSPSGKRQSVFPQPTRPTLVASANDELAVATDGPPSPISLPVLDGGTGLLTPLCPAKRRSLMLEFSLKKGGMTRLLALNAEQKIQQIGT